jgi:hypothetical protein
MPPRSRWRTVDAACDRCGEEENDQIDVSKIADWLRCDFLPEAT